MKMVLKLKICNPDTRSAEEMRPRQMEQAQLKGLGVRVWRLRALFGFRV